MTIDMSKYLALFVSESTEHLDALARELVAFEKGRNAETIDAMFRHAHSVKGMASSMGFEPIAILAHRMEDLVDAVRAEPSRLDRSLVDLLLGAVDTLLALVKSAGAGNPPGEVGELLDQLSARVAALTGQAPTPTRVANAVVRVPSDSETRAEPKPAEPRLGASPRFTLRLRINPACPTPGVRGFLVHRKLSGLGNVFDLRPPLDDLKAGRISDGLVSLDLETSTPEAQVVQLLKQVPDVELLSIKTVDLGAVAAPVPPKETAPAETVRVVGAEPARTVRVKTELLDYLLDSVGELLLATARIREVGKLLPEHARPPLEESVYRLHTLVKDLHDKVMSVRMTPLSLITDRLPRAARDIARKRDRDIDLLITGAEIELDRSILDDLADPLLHLLRNCIDHGIEPAEERVAQGKPAKGTVQLTMRRQRDRVVIELGDDGRGMDVAKLKASALARGLLTSESAARLTDREALMLACLPGVSTAKDVSEISGRGVGMDAVKRTVEDVGGSIEIESQRGRGTRFTLRLPLTVSVINLLLAKVGDEVVGLPINKVLGVLELDRAQLSESRGAAMLSWGGAMLEAHSLADLLNVPHGAVSVSPYIIMEAESGKVALAVDKLLGQEEAVLKSLSRPLDLVPGLSGVTILGNGRPIFILDVPRLLS